jgi:hypothetical protein
MIILTSIYGNIEMKKVIYTGLLLLACDQSYGASATPMHGDGAFIDEGGLLRSSASPVSKPSRRRTGSRRVAPMPELDCPVEGSLSTITRTGSMSTATTPSPEKRRARGFSYAPAEAASTADPKAVWKADADIKKDNDKAVAKAMEGVATSKAAWTAVDIKKDNDKAVARVMAAAALEESISRSGAAAAKPVASKNGRRLFSGTPGGRTKAISESEDEDD